MLNYAQLLESFIIHHHHIMTDSNSEAECSLMYSQVRVEAGRVMTEDAMRKGQQSSNEGRVRASAVHPSRHFRRQPVIGIALLQLYGARHWHMAGL